MGKINLTALVDEATDEPHVVEFKGESFEIGAIETWPLDTVDALNRGDITEAMRGAFGDEDWERFAALKPSLRAVRMLVESLTDAQGMDLPSSSGSSRSSRSTGTRSRRTSNSGTASIPATSGAPAEG